MPIPAGWSQKDYEKRLDAISVCGKNRGPHDWIPVRWHTDAVTAIKEITHLMCRVCYNKVNVATLIREFSDLSIRY
jgi:hypothetical protein